MIAARSGQRRDQPVMAQLPPGTASTVRRMDPTVFPIIAYSLTSQTVPLTTLRDIGVVPIETSADRGSRRRANRRHRRKDEEFQILVNAARLAAYGLSFDDVAKAVASANVLARSVGSRITTSCFSWSRTRFWTGSTQSAAPS
jgi:multidrug efflux pump subunit AcrB